MGPIELAVRPGLRCPEQLPDRLEVAEPRGDPEVARLAPEHVDDSPVAPEERGDQRRAAVSSGGEIRPGPCAQQQLGQLAPVGVARLVELRPAVVVAAVRVAAALEQQPDELEVLGHAQQIVAVRPALPDELRNAVEKLGEPIAVAGLDGPVGEHERRGRLRAASKPAYVAAQTGPAPEAVAPGEVEPRLVEGHTGSGRDSLRAPVVVREVGSERLLPLEPLCVGLELRPAREAVLPRELELGLAEGELLARAAPFAHAVLRLLTELLEIHRRPPSTSPTSASRAGEEIDSLHVPG